MIPAASPVAVKLVAGSVASLLFMMTALAHISVVLAALAAAMPIAAAMADKGSEKTLDQLNGLVSALTTSGLAGAAAVSRRVIESRARLRRIRWMLFSLALAVPALIVIVGTPGTATVISAVAAAVFYRSALEGKRTLERAITLKEQLERDLVGARKRSDALRTLETMRR